VDLHWWTARELSRAVRERELSAREVVAAHLERIAAVNTKVNAIVSLRPEAALAEADVADRQAANGAPLGPLHGLPIAIKDLEDTAGIRTTYGSRAFAGHVPDTDSPLVRRIRAAGAIVVGKTNTPEFGTGSHTFNEVFGVTRNPWSLDRSAGGSSGGAGAALAAGADARAPLSYGDPDEFSGELAGAIAGLRVGWCRDVGGLPVEPAVAAVMARARARFVELGAVVEDVALDLEAADLAFETLRALGYARLAHEAPELLGVVKDTVRWNIERGFELDGETVARAIAARGEVFATVAAACSRFDVLAAPAAQVVPFPIEVEFPTNVAGVEMPHYIGWMRACSRLTVSSHPVAAVPAGFTDDGLPVGLQLVGRFRGDRRLLEHAAAWEAATGFTDRRPALT
jgi:amidase